MSLVRGESGNRLVMTQPVGRAGGSDPNTAHVVVNLIYTYVQRLLWC